MSIIFIFSLVYDHLKLRIFVFLVPYDEPCQHSIRTGCPTRSCTCVKVSQWSKSLKKSFNHWQLSSLCDEVIKQKPHWSVLEIYNFLHESYWENCLKMKFGNLQFNFSKRLCKNDNMCSSESELQSEVRNSISKLKIKLRGLHYDFEINSYSYSYYFILRYIFTVTFITKTFFCSQISEFWMNYVNTELNFTYITQMSSSLRH